MVPEVQELMTHNVEKDVPECDLPGMWEYADFTGHAFWGMDPSGHCTCADCNAPDPSTTATPPVETEEDS